VEALQGEEEEGVKSKGQFIPEGKATLRFTHFPTNKHKKIRRMKENSIKTMYQSPVRVKQTKLKSKD
jgi:hypothetical protein